MSEFVSEYTYINISFTLMNTTNLTMTYAIFGDSYIKRLEVYTRGNLNFFYKCNFYGVSGMSTRRKFNPMYEKLKNDKPRYVFLNVGGNNINKNCTPAEIFHDIRHIVDDLKSAGVERIFVASIVERGRFPPYTGITAREFNAIRRSVNEKLKHHFKGDYVDCGKWLKYPRHYDDDLVHPGNVEGGMEVLKCIMHRCFSKTLN